jgi:hypothetical protein
MDTHLVLELDYINYFSLWNNIKIPVKTIPGLISNQVQIDPNSDSFSNQFLIEEALIGSFRFF